jgi:Putative zinc dependent peptidase (DUF5700)
MILIRFFKNISLIVVFILCSSYSQNNPNFNVTLLTDYRAAEQTIALTEGQSVSTASVAELRGNKIAASTVGLIAGNRSLPLLLRDYLDSLRYNLIIQNDIFNLEQIKSSSTEIKELLNELKLKNFARRVIATVEQMFPADADVSVSIPVYIVAIGHENADAFVRRIEWQGENYRFVGENEGELTIVINLTQAVKYGNQLEDRFLSLLGVVAHEVFHASFSAYKERSKIWQEFYSTHTQPLDILLDLVQNEGIAYYLSLDQQGKGYLPRDWNEHIRSAFSTLNKNARELVSRQLTTSRASEILRSANLSGYWESYGSIAGMAIAREIDLQLGRSSLIETISKGPYEFITKYNNLVKGNSNLPALDATILKNIQN